MDGKVIKIEIEGFRLRGTPRVGRTSRVEEYLHEKGINIRQGKEFGRDMDA